LLVVSLITRLHGESIALAALVLLVPLLLSLG
jgi:hypothetical protein